MEFRCLCECGYRFKKIIENPSDDQVADEMYYGFLSVSCEDHK